MPRNITRGQDLIGVTAFADGDYIIIYRADGSPAAKIRKTDFINTIGDGDLGVMLKAIYDPDNDGIVVAADEIGGINAAGITKYYGTNSSSMPGFFDLPIGAPTDVFYITSAADISGLLSGDTYISELKEYRVYGDIDLDVNKFLLKAGARLRFSTAAMSTFTSSHSDATIEVEAGPAVASITGGGFVTNTGGGAAVDVLTGGLLFIANMLLSSPTGTALKADAPGLLAGNTITTTTSVNGFVITGTAGFVNISQSSTANISGKGFQVGAATFLNLDSYNGTSAGDNITISGDIADVMLTGSASSTAGAAVKVTATGSTTSISTNNFRASGAQGGFDFTGSLILVYTGSGGSVISTGMAFGALIGDANSANTAAFGGMQYSSMSIFNVAGGPNLDGGITKKDARNRFFNCVGVLNSITIGDMLCSSVSQLAIEGSPTQVAGTYSLDAISERMTMPTSGDLRTDTGATRLYRIELLIRGAKSTGSAVTFEFHLTRSQDDGSTFPIDDLIIDFTVDSKGNEGYGFVFVEAEPADRWNIEITTATGEGNATFVGEVDLVVRAVD